MGVAGIPQPSEGPNGTIYMASDFVGVQGGGSTATQGYQDYGPAFAYRTYAHELTNILDARIYGTGAGWGYHWGLQPPPFNDPDSGAAVEFTLFGPRLNFRSTSY